MNRDCLITILGVLIQAGELTRAAADHFLACLDKSLEDGINLTSIEKVLEVLNG